MTKQFPSEVRGDISVNIPSNFAKMNDVREGDVLLMEVLTHKRDGDIVYEA